MASEPSSHLDVFLACLKRVKMQPRPNRPKFRLPRLANAEESAAVCSPEYYDEPPLEEDASGVEMAIEPNEADSDVGGDEGSFKKLRDEDQEPEEIIFVTRACSPISKESSSKQRYVIGLDGTKQKLDDASAPPYQPKRRNHGGQRLQSVSKGVQGLQADSKRKQRLQSVSKGAQGLQSDSKRKQRLRSVWKCKHCNYTSNVSSNVGRHSVRMHTTLPNPARCCDLAFFTHFDLREHNRERHEVGRKFPCPYPECVERGVSFNQRAAFAAHVDGVHLGIKPYRCSLCTYASTHKGNVTRHMLTHASDVKQQTGTEDAKVKLGPKKEKAKLVPKEAKLVPNILRRAVLPCAEL